MTRPGPGEVSLPWLASGRSVRIPELTLGDHFELGRREVLILDELGLTDDTPAWKRAKLEELANTRYASEAVLMRLQKADPGLTRERFEGALNPLSLQVLVAQIARSDGPRDFPWAPKRGRAAEVWSWLKNASRMSGRASPGSRSQRESP